jgi:DNA-binding transcriptional MerR regulator
VDYRVEELAAKAELSVDTLRFYQAKGLLPPPTRVGRVGWYHDDHLDRLAQIRRLQSRGLSLAVIGRLLAGELDRVDEELVAAIATATATATDDVEEWLTLQELAERSGIPVALLQAIEREGLLVPRQIGGELRYTSADATAAAAGLKLLERGLPLPELLELARAHSVATRVTAERAVELFDRYVRDPLRAEDRSDEEAAARLVSAFEEVLAATLTIVTHHFRRTLLAVAQEHIEQVGSEDERQVVAAWAG